MIRAFLAVELGEDLRKRMALAQEDLRQLLDRKASREVRIAWVRPASIHLTIKFLGDIDEQLVEPLREGILRAVAGHRAIHVPIERLGCFPRPQQPKVLWVGASDRWEQGEEAGRLQSLHAAVEACCRSFGFAREERPFSPHLTLARVKAGERLVGQLLAKAGVMDRPLPLGTLAVGSVVLMKSELRPSGSVYTKLWEAVPIPQRVNRGEAPTEAAG
jgi:2'-5' RNA ligase